MFTKWRGDGEPYEYQEIGADEIRECYNNLWVTLETAGLGLGEAELSTIISIFLDTCPYCMNAPRPCHCNNDE